MRLLTITGTANPLLGARAMPGYIGIDYGTRRIGLAVGDTVTGIASPLQTVESRGNPAEAVAAVVAAVRRYDVDGFVVGLPVNMDGTEGSQAKTTRAFGDELRRVTGLDVHYRDERLSSVTAQELLLPAELSRGRRKAVQDSVAAQVILQEFLDAKTTENQDCS